MFDQVDKDLEEWVRSVHNKTEATFMPPDIALTKDCICLYLLDVTPNPTGRGNKSSPLQITLRYLIIPFAKEPLEAHQILGQLLVAALENKEFEVEKEPLPVAAWSAFGIAPHPSFILRVPFKIEKPAKLAPPVRHPLVLQQSSLQTLQGKILGAGDSPIMNAQVEIPELNRSTLTDYKGRFRFSAVPSEPSVKKLLVRAKGRAFTINTDQKGNLDENLTIYLKLEE